MSRGDLYKLPQRAGGIRQRGIGSRAENMPLASHGLRPRCRDPAHLPMGGCRRGSNPPRVPVSLPLLGSIWIFNDVGGFTASFGEGRETARFRRQAPKRCACPGEEGGTPGAKRAGGRNPSIIRSGRPQLRKWLWCRGNSVVKENRGGSRKRDLVHNVAAPQAGHRMPVGASGTVIRAEMPPTCRTGGWGY